MIGFRLKFDDISNYNLKNFLLNYVSKFDFFEIKLTNTLLKENKLPYILELSEKYAKGRYSIHLPKDFLNSEFDSNIRQEIIRCLKNFKCTSQIFLILHMPYYYNAEFLQKLSKLTKALEKNYCILLENEKNLKSNLEYLKKIDFVIGYMIQKNIKNIGICFDIGHFQYGILKEGVSSELIYSSLSSLKHFSKYIKEYHLHDYNENQDHLQLRHGIMKLEEVSNFINKINGNCPIILEANINNPDLDGKQQIKIVKKYVLMKGM